MQSGGITSDIYELATTESNIFEFLLSVESVNKNVLADFVGSTFNSVSRFNFDITDVSSVVSAFPAVDRELSSRYGFFPMDGGDHRSVRVAIINPFNHRALQDIGFALDVSHVEPFICSRSELDDLVSMALDDGSGGFSETFEFEVSDDEADTGSAINLDELERQGNESSVVSLVNQIISSSISIGASDIHIEGGECSSRARIRLDGKLQLVKDFPSSIHPSLISRIKIMSSLDISNTRTPQDGRINLILRGKSVDMRVSILPTAKGEKVVMRILDKSGLSVDMDMIGLSTRDMDVVMNAVAKKDGACLVTGPTGSGKTTTLYSFLNNVNDVEKNIVTVEDPVEFMLEGINQVSVNVKKGLTFAGALRSILRQDPDIIMLGEIRDSETAGIALEAAQTGHMVMSTLHTNDAPSVITRLRELGLDPSLLAQSLNAIVAQRLIRRLCKCKERGFPTELQSKTIGIPADFPVYVPVGCDKCNKGYKGRAGIHEVVKMTDVIKAAINNDATHAELVTIAREEGMLTIFENGLNRVIDGTTSLAEVMESSVIADGFNFADRFHDCAIQALGYRPKISFSS